MKTLSDYRTTILSYLGDASGRRYSTAQVDLSLSQALATYAHFLPRRDGLTVQIKAVSGQEAELSGWPEPGFHILEIWDSSGVNVGFREVRPGVIAFPEDRTPRAGQKYRLIISAPHTVSGLDNAGTTTIPDNHFLEVCSGAAGNALYIRARSVTEVFGKRPEDRAALMEQGQELIRAYEGWLNVYSALYESAETPWSRMGFPI